MTRADQIDSLRRGASIASTNALSRNGSIFSSLTRNNRAESINSQASTVVEKNSDEKDVVEKLEKLDFGFVQGVEDGRKIIVGIDFGTTFSGVAWAETRRVSISLLSL
jgi:hypothetical protein